MHGNVHRNRGGRALASLSIRSVDHPLTSVELYAPCDADERIFANADRARGDTAAGVICFMNAPLAKYIMRIRRCGGCRWFLEASKFSSKGGDTEVQNPRRDIVVSSSVPIISARCQCQVPLNVLTLLVSMLYKLLISYVCLLNQAQRTWDRTDVLKTPPP
jgi:hypothetical protein